MSNKTSKSTAQHGPGHWDELLDREFENESDRASVILAAALLDAALELLLRAFMRPCSTGEDPLFEGANAPIGTFSARIDVAYRLGLLDLDFSRALHLVRRIRNDFAHNIAGCTFADSAVMGRLAELRRLTRLLENGGGFRNNYPDGPRGDFQYVISWLQFSLRSLSDDVLRVEPSHHAVGAFLPNSSGELPNPQPAVGNEHNAPPDVSGG
jgi:hypothetical protein